MRATHDCLTNEFTVELNLIGEHLDPERVTAILGLRPLRTARAGDARSTPNGGCYQEGFWIHEVVSNDDIHECRDHLLNRLADAVAPHTRQLSDAGVERIYFYYTMSSSIGLLNIRFKAQTMEKLSRLGADLYVSCYDCFDPKHPYWNILAEPSNNGAAGEGR
ncbi:MAG TPA: DUF4279 domain-containing protein [Candidatus Kapabacteria bacterium]|nr:DUF4279 domain-containing protein [Candidatus Kapabacteria bacterium]